MHYFEPPDVLIGESSSPVTNAWFLESFDVELREQSCRLVARVTTFVELEAELDDEALSVPWPVTIVEHDQQSRPHLLMTSQSIASEVQLTVPDKLFRK